MAELQTQGTGRSGGRTDRRRFLQTVGGGTAALTLSPLLQACSRQTTRPNVILIMADDLGFEGLSCNGGTSYDTPHLDELARSGIRFTDCHSQPLCTPSRVQLMTGKYNFRNYTEFGTLDPGEVTFGHLMQNAGYATCVAGKWQLSGRVEGANYHGVGTLPGLAGFDEHCLWQVEHLGSRYWNPLITRNGELFEGPEDAYGPDLCCTFLNDFIRRNAGRPFFAYYPMILTHDPFSPTPNSEVESGRAGVRGREFFGDMVAYMDSIVGRIVRNLEELGLRENTLLIFTTDNGTHRNITSRMGEERVTGGKGRTLATATHVPLIASQPGVIPRNEICNDLIDFTDFLPTIIEATGTDIESASILDGQSFLPQLQGRRGDPREWIFCHYDPRWGQWQPDRFVMDREWKLYGDGRFYHLVNDPLEEQALTPSGLGQDAVRIRDRFQMVLDRMH